MPDRTLQGVVLREVRHQILRDVEIHVRVDVVFSRLQMYRIIADLLILSWSIDTMVLGSISAELGSAL